MGPCTLTSGASERYQIVVRFRGSRSSRMVKTLGTWSPSRSVAAFPASKPVALLPCCPSWCVEGGATVASKIHQSSSHRHQRIQVGARVTGPVVPPLLSFPHSSTTPLYRGCKVQLSPALLPVKQGFAERALTPSPASHCKPTLTSIYTHGGLACCSLCCSWHIAASHGTAPPPNFDWR